MNYYYQCIFFLLLFMNWMWFFNLFQQNCFILWEYSNLFFHGWEFLIFDTKKINSNKIIFLLLFLHSILFYFLFIFFPLHIEFQSFVTFDDRWVKTLWFHIHTHTHHVIQIERFRSVNKFGNKMKKKSALFHYYWVFFPTIQKFLSFLSTPFPHRSKFKSLVYLLWPLASFFFIFFFIRFSNHVSVANICWSSKHNTYTQTFNVTYSLNSIAVGFEKKLSEINLFVCLLA